MHNLQNTVLLHNPDKHRFELEVDNVVAYVDYSQNTDRVVFLTHTEVPSELEGKGVGSVLMSRTLDWIALQGYRMVPLCPFAAAYLKRHPEYHQLLAPGYSH